MEPGEEAEDPGMGVNALRVVEEGKSPTSQTRMQGQIIEEDKKIQIVLCCCGVRSCALHVKSLTPAPLIQPIDALHKINNYESAS